MRERGGPNPEDSAAIKELVAKITPYLKRLTANEALILDLVFFKGKSSEQISAETGFTPEYVQELTGFALDRLRRVLPEELVRSNKNFIGKLKK